jgi:RNA polymerase sigma-70 factor (ECF subfamily)
MTATDHPALAAADGGEAEDEALMAAYAAGDADAFDQLYARYRGPVYRFFLRQFGAVDAEEAHQDTWLRLIRTRSAYRPSGPFRSLLFTIAHNVATDRYRLHARRPPPAEGADPDDRPGDGDTVETAHRDRLSARLHGAIRRLPAAQREALVLREETGMTHGEIARVIGGTAEGVKSRLRYAMQTLRTELAPYADEH